MEIFPLLGSRKPSKISTSVVFPEPVSPIIPIDCLLSKEKFKFSKTNFDEFGYLNSTFLNSIDLKLFIKILLNF